MWHDTGSGASELPSGGWLEPGEHSENPATKRRLKNLLDATGLTDRLVASCRRARRPSRSSAACTRRAYVDRIRELSAGPRRRRRQRGSVRQRLVRDRPARRRGNDHRDRRGARRHRRQRLCARAPSRPPRASRSRNGVLHLRERRRRRPPRAGVAGHREGRRRRLGRPPRQRDAGGVLGRPVGARRSRSTRTASTPRARVSSRTRVGRPRSGTTLNIPLPAGSGTGAYLDCARPGRRPGARGVRARADRDRLRVRRGRARPARAHAAARPPPSAR